MKENKDLEWRMMGFVPYNISEIQKGIQFGHAVVEYANTVNVTDNRLVSDAYRKWSRFDKTFIILNGGTTNAGINPGPGFIYGTMDTILDTLEDMDIPHASFREPDLNHALTAIVFLVSEVSYDFNEWPDVVSTEGSIDQIIERQKIANIQKYGKKTMFLRELIRNKKLA